MNVQEVLRTRRVEIQAEIETLKNEMTQIDAALGVLDNDPETVADKKPLTREEAIIEAVRNGNTRPTTIHKFVKSKLRMNLNIGSLRSTLSRLKSDGRIHHDGTGWIM